MAVSLPKDRASLVAACARGERFDYLFFWGHQAPKEGGLGPGVFSQWWPQAFTVEGVEYLTAEHWMMASKARLFGDAAALEKILAAPTPAAAKALGRTVQGFTEERWREHRERVVAEGSAHKFGSDPALREYLLGTGSKVLVEASPRDRIWGIGMGASNPEAQDPSRWRGSNLLGFALLRAREALSAKK